jgi:hypothetical protein
MAVDSWWWVRVGLVRVRLRGCLLSLKLTLFLSLFPTLGFGCSEAASSVTDPVTGGRVREP